ncbi:MAG: enoyl-CoA hydratase-related protein [Myxococcota bacterium]|nr:enoyl-CoA hydratase-related protein [Myxococcota bacterium]
MVEAAGGSDATVLADTKDGVLTLTLNRPAKRNAVDVATARALAGALGRAAADRSVRVVVLTGANDTFCAGGDLTPDESSDPPGSIVAASLGVLQTGYGDAFLALQRLPKPTLAAVAGTAAGAGANLALACDFVCMADDARLGEVFVKRGLSLDCGGSWLLPRLVGLQKAKEIAFFGDWIAADEALRLGLATRVFPASELAARVAEWAARLAEQAPLAVSLIKQSLNRSFELSLPDALEQEAVAQAACAASNDFAEAMQAFAEKRPPRFTGS